MNMCNWLQNRRDALTPALSPAGGGEGGPATAEAAEGEAGRFIHPTGGWQAGAGPNPLEGGLSVQWSLGLGLLGLIGSGAVFLWSLLQAASAEPKTHKLTSVSIRKMADSVHAVIAADRQAYAELVMHRLLTQSNAPVPITANWRQQHGLPVHAQMLRWAGQSIQKRGAEFSYVLRSLWPINPSHGPQTEVEQQGLEAVARNPDQPFYTEEELGGRSYFTAVYADRATLSSCADCHNRHPASPRKDFKVGDVMGAVVVRVPLEF